MNLERGYLIVRFALRRVRRIRLAHAAIEELYVLDGNVWIDDRKLDPGDYEIASLSTARMERNGMHVLSHHQHPGTFSGDIF